MVKEYQTNPNIFGFLLSTRAGGLGINLVAVLYVSAFVKEQYSYLTQRFDSLIIVEAF